MKAWPFLLLILSLPKTQAQSIPDYSICHTDSSQTDIEEPNDLKIQDWIRLKKFLKDNETRLGGGQQFLHNYQGSGDSRIRINMPTTTPHLATEQTPLGRSRETFDEGGLLAKCEKLGHTPWSSMLEKYQETPSTNAFAPASKQKVNELLQLFPGKLKEKNYDDFIYLLFLKSDNLENLTNSIRDECKKDNRPIRGIIVEHFKNIFSLAVTEQIEELHKLQKKIELCEGMLGITKWSDFSDTANGDRRRTSSFDGRIQCQSFGNNTQDFPKCQSAVNFYNVAAVSQHALNQVQGIRHQGKMMDGQQQLSTGGPFNHTGALEYQKEGIKSMKGIARQSAAFDSIKLAKFLEIVKKIPTTASLHESCTQRHTQSVQNHLQTLYDQSVQIYKAAITDYFKNTEVFPNNTQPFSPTNSDAVCMASIQNEDTLLRNQKARDVAKQMAIKAGVDMGTNLAKATILGKQEKTLDGIIQKVEEHNPKNVVGFKNQALKIEECQFNPNAPKCQQKGGDFQDIGNNGGSVTITAGDGNNNPGSFGAKDDDQGAAKPQDIPSGQKFSGNLAPLPSSIAKGGSGLANTIPASRLKPGSGASSGGGPSEGSPPGGGSPSGGSPNSGDRKKRQKKHRVQKVGSYSKRSGALKGFYTPKGSGQLSKKREMASENPFKKLFKNKAPKGKYLLFSDIGDSGSTLFKRISARYKSVYLKKRPLKFEDI